MVPDKGPRDIRGPLYSLGHRPPTTPPLSELFERLYPYPRTILMSLLAPPTEDSISEYEVTIPPAQPLSDAALRRLQNGGRVSDSEAATSVSSTEYVDDTASHISDSYASSSSSELSSVTQNSEIREDISPRPLKRLRSTSPQSPMAATALLGEDVSRGPSKLGIDAGKGLFAERDFSTGSFITKMEGTLLSQQEYNFVRSKRSESRKIGTMISKTHPDNWRVFKLPDDVSKEENGAVAMLVPKDPQFGIGAAGYANDAYNGPVTRHGIVNNAELVSTQDVNGSRCLALRALTFIRTGSEIFFNYGDDWWRTNFVEIEEISLHQDDTESVTN